MPLRRFDPAAVLSVQYIWDDFPGLLYNNRIWSTRSGSGSVAINATCIGGQIRVRGNASNYYEVYQSALQFSLAKRFQVTWLGKVVDLTTARSAWGMQTDADNRVEWLYSSAIGANWQVRSVAATVETVTDTGIAADTNWHEFKIVGITGLIHFFLDNVPVSQIATNLPPGNLAPHIRSDSATAAAARDTLADWVEAYGDRV